jgi:hypothetical protein
MDAILWFSVGMLTTAVAILIGRIIEETRW